MLSLGPSFGLGSGLGLSADGGFQSEMEESASEMGRGSSPSNSDSNMDVT